MNTKLLEIFHEVANTQSFAKAARNLDLDPSVVSRSVQQLEEELNCLLLHRTTRRLSLSQAGLNVLQQSKAILEQLARLKDQAANETQNIAGRVCISASVAFGQVCLMPFVEEFINLYPKIQLELKFTDQNIDLVSEKVDFAIRLAPSIESNFVRTRLMTTNYKVCASSRYLNNHQTIGAPNDLTKHRLITFDLADFKHCWMFKYQQNIIDIQVKPQLTVSSALAVRDAIIDGIGIGLLPNWLSDDLIKQKQLVNLFPHHQVCATSFDTAAWIIYQNRSFMPLRTRVAIDFFKQKIAEHFSPKY
ncbi:LysR family transcriptional regulator [Catenovulum sp. SX2]|uniref:LysR family transcriptional regulator n=1 Tax=Catenovulum sp. SX2 TaxID=3398614 RepID=UPI003F859DBE